MQIQRDSFPILKYALRLFLLNYGLSMGLYPYIITEQWAVALLTLASFSTPLNYLIHQSILF